MIAFDFYPNLNMHWCYKPDPNPMMDDSEMATVMALCMPKEMRPIHILEIGTHRGGMTRNLAKMVKGFGGKVVTVDVNTLPKTISDNQIGEVLPAEEVGCDIPEDLRKHVKQLLITPDTLEKALKNVEGPGDTYQYDIAFLDGDHSYMGVCSDYYTVRNFVKRGGIIALHDVWWDAVPPPVSGPLQLAEEIGAVVLNLGHVAVVTNQR